MALVVSALFVVAMPATAAVKIATLTGIGFGADNNQVFGYGVGDPNHVEWVATFTYDTASSTLQTFPNFNAARVSNVTMLGSTFTANGVTLSSGVTTGGFTIDYGEYEINGGATLGVFDFNISARGNNRYILGLTGSTTGMPLPISFERNFPTIDSPSNNQDYFDFDNYSGFFLLESRTISVADAPVVVVPGAVPEPAGWAMMIIGFGAAGSMIRRRKAVTA